MALLARSNRMYTSIHARRQLLADQVSLPAFLGQAARGFAPCGGFDVGLSITQFQQQSRILDLFLELAHGPVHVAVGHYH